MPSPKRLRRVMRRRGNWWVRIKRLIRRLLGLPGADSYHLSKARTLVGE